MKITIDAGHSYHTAGKRTVDGSMREWEFNSRVAEIVKDELSLYEDVEIMFTHDETGERDVPLQERTDKANAWGADVFISIHANAFGSGGWNTARGIETFVYTTQPKEALKLARAVQDNLIDTTGMYDRGVKNANFHVLRETKMTAILTESGGFMTNKHEAEQMKTEKYRKKVAKAIVSAIVSTYILTKKPTILYTVQVGAFSNKKLAEIYAKEIEAAGFPTFVTTKGVK